MTYSAKSALPISVTDPNPFVTIQPTFRLLIIAYLSVYVVLPNIVEGLIFDLRPLAIPRTLSVLLNSLLLYGPLLFFPNKRIGWLHPLVLPALVSIAVSLAQNADGLLHPIDTTIREKFSFVGLENYSQSDLAWVDLKKNCLQSLFLICYLLSFFSLRRMKVGALRLVQPQLLWVRLAAAGLLGAVAAALVIQQNGGIEATIIGLAGGRFRFRESVGGGHFIKLTELLKYSWLIWYAYRPKAIFNPLFYVYILGSLAAVFIVSGSRSGIIYPLMFLGLLYMVHTRRVPVLTFLVAGIIGVAVVGILGEIRTSGNRGDVVNVTAIVDKDFTEHVNATREQVSARISGNMMVVGKGMETVGPLWGRTYLAAIFFFVPRAIWKTKPRGAGAYAGNFLLYNRDFTDHSFGGDALGIPVSPPYEAYWNFWYPGVVLMGGLFGLFHRYLTNFFLKQRGHPLVWVIYLLGVGFTSFATASLVAFVQGLSMVLILAFLAYLWRPSMVFAAIKTRLA